MQELAVPPHDATELAAAFLQTGITLGVALVCVYLYVRYRRSYFAVWAAAWALYALRLGSIVSFLSTGVRVWLYWHQVLTGWTALAFLWAALAFSEEIRWRRAYWVLLLFPPVWSYLAIYRLQNFFLAAGPAVLFLSVATASTGVILWRHHRRMRSLPAAITALAFFLWSLHHLDYPFLRARGAWNPWGYYLDIVFELAIGAGILLLVLEDQHRGLSVLSSLSGDLQGGEREEDLLDALLQRPLTLPAVRGSAMYRMSEGVFAEGAGVCAVWGGRPPDGVAERAIARVLETGRPEAIRGPRRGEGREHAYVAALPIFRGERIESVLVVVGSARDPFAVLDERFLVALGHQVGAALSHADLYRRLEERKAELERLASRMVHQHEEERRRLSRELHDESAQVFAAVKLQLGLARETAAPEQRAPLDQALSLVSSGIRSIRAVARDLRPSLLDDLGLLPALRALAADFRERSEMEVRVSLPETVPPLPAAAELALFRALQEGLSNVARHAGASRVHVALREEQDDLLLEVRDDGRGVSPGGAEGEERMGLLGMRERLAPLGGSVELRDDSGRGAALHVRLPVRAARTSAAAEAPE